jgi:hypothetical protein
MNESIDSEVCPYCDGDEMEMCDKCGDYFTSCEECGEMNIPVDYDGMAPDVCRTCEIGDSPVMGVILTLTDLLDDLQVYIPSITGNTKAGYLSALDQAVTLLRTHALPDDSEGGDQ